MIAGAAARALRNNSRTAFSDSPTHFESSSGPWRYRHSRHHHTSFEVPGRLLQSSEVLSCRQLCSASRHNLTVPLHYRLNTFGPFRSPVLLHGTLHWIVSMIQHQVLTVLLKYLKRSYLQVIKHKHTKRYINSRLTLILTELPGMAKK